MHDIEIRQEIVDRVLARRNRYHLFDSLDPATTAIVIVDMQNTFVEDGSPAEVPASRDICEDINRLNAAARDLGVKVIWVTHANTNHGGRSDWSGFFDHFVDADIRQRTIESLAPGKHGQQIYETLEVDDTDLHTIKNRYSALIPGSSGLERMLRGYGVTNVLVAGTKTNVCCEATARDAMMLDFNVVMVSDCLAALSDEEHRATLETFIQQFGDVMTVDEVVAVLRNRTN
jgi:ureidoacrylate peracid hydrolase